MVVCNQRVNYNSGSSHKRPDSTIAIGYNDINNNNNNNNTHQEHQHSSNGWQPEDGVPDLAMMMGDITDEGININLKTRYLRDQIYTFSGSILIAVNPYKQLNIYDESWIERFRNQKLDPTQPHVFALTEAMYKSLVMRTTPKDVQDTSASKDGNSHEEKSNQSSTSSSFAPHINQACVISGESGAGKTETTKFILSYLCSITPTKSTWMEHQILEANTILEAFGNSKTVRNDNSSRFGKFIQICFDSRHQINGCIIQDYLLEQSRITYQSNDERNYHVFYQLLAAAKQNNELRKRFHLMPATFYNYLNQTQCYNVDQVDDCQMFDSLRTAMSVLGIEQEHCDSIFAILSAILWLGNLQFKTSSDDDDKLEANNNSNSNSNTDLSITNTIDPEQASLTECDNEILKIVSKLLGIPIDQIKSILLDRQINVRGTITQIPLKVHEARDNRNSISKLLYSRLFAWLVKSINESTNPGHSSSCFLGVLDIFGFENFDRNSFEQLCINYANEKLHKFFNHHMFAMEQQLYKDEGIDFCDINYTDNTPCLELLERPPSCILRLLTEECRMPKGNDATFIEKLHQEFSNVQEHPFYLKGSDRRNWSSEFSVKHFAGTVTYSVSGFLKKNKDVQQSHFIELLESSQSDLLKSLAYCGNSNNYNNCLSRQSNDTRLRSSSSDYIEAQHVGLTRHDSIDSTDRQSIAGRRHNFLRRESFTPASSYQTGKPLSQSQLSSFQGQGNIQNQTQARTRVTVADSFRQQLASLVELLNSTHPWYVRCIKPNLEKSATHYNDKQVMMQLKYLGMSDLIRIRREGYPIHFTKQQFVSRYRCLMARELRQIGSLDDKCNQMMSHLGMDRKYWKIGKTMVFLRANVYQPMEEARQQLFIQMSTLIQASWRAHKLHKRYKLMRTSATLIQENFRAYRTKLLYLRKKRAALTIQAYVRGMFAREIANALREIKRAEEEAALKQRQELILRQQQLQREQEQKELEIMQQELQHQNQNPIKLPQVSVSEHVDEIVENNGENETKFQDGEICDTSNGLELAPSNNLQGDLNSGTGGANTPLSQLTHESSPAISSSTSWVATDQPVKQNHSGVSEMDQLVRVLEKHGTTLEALDQKATQTRRISQSVGSTYADFGKLYDLLGHEIGQQQDSHNGSASPSVQEQMDDDHDSNYAASTTTTTTNNECEPDSVSCSGQSQVSSTLADDHDQSEQHLISRNDDSNHNELSLTNHDEQTINNTDPSEQSKLGERNSGSNSIESIASISSNASAIQQQQPNQSAPTRTPDLVDGATCTKDNQETNEDISNAKQVFDLNQVRQYSTFGKPLNQGATLTVAGSKAVTNGRPLTRIEEEPNSTLTSPSKTPHHQRNQHQQSLFGPCNPQTIDLESSASKSTANFSDQNRKKRIERAIQQVQQEKQRQILQLQQQQQIHNIAPTQAGLLPASAQQSANQQTYSSNQNQTTSDQQQATTDESIYDLEKSNIIDYAEQVFNRHPRDSNGNSSKSGGVIRTLTRRRKSLDTLTSEYLTKGEMLSYNSNASIPTSHLRMHDPHNVQLSCSIFKNLCKYMTGESSKFDVETRVLQSIIRNGIEKAELRDEIYVQIMRQLTNNPNSEYCSRLWKLLCLTTASFGPSKAFSKHLIAYIRNKPRKDPSITCYAQFCLDNLQAPRLNTRKLPPSPVEIQACSSLTNMICNIQLLDGRCETISVHPSDTVQDALMKLAQRINLQSIEGWSLYESYTPGRSKYAHPCYEQRGDLERSVRLHHYMADIMANWQGELPRKLSSANVLKLAQKRILEGNFRLTLKKRIFRGPLIRNDPVEISLLYAQAVYNAVKKDNFLVDETLALSLAGLQAQAMLGNWTDLWKLQENHRKGKPNRVTAKNYTHQYDIENYICPRHRHASNRSKKDWSALISQSHKQFHNVNGVLCKMRYLSMVIYHCPLYGTTAFKVTYKGYQNLDQNLLLGVNSEGLVFIRASDRELVCAYRYTDISNESGVMVYLDENILQLNVRDRADNSSMKCLNFETNDAQEISMLMKSYNPSLLIKTRGGQTEQALIDPNFEVNLAKKKPKLKMTLEDRLRIHQEVHTNRRAIIQSGKLRKPIQEEGPNPGGSNLIKYTIKKLSSNNVNSSSSQSNKNSNRFDSIYGTLGKPVGRSRQVKGEIVQTSSDYNLYGASISRGPNESPLDIDRNQGCFDEYAGATVAETNDELSKLYPHRYWAYTKVPLKNSLLIIHDPELEEASIANFNSILTFSGLIGPQHASIQTQNVYDCGSIDSGIASQQSLTNGTNSNITNSQGNSNGKVTRDSPSSNSSEIYEVCPKKIDERELLKLAQVILDRCLKKGADILKNEFFLQLIKQTTDFPEANSEINKRHWQLLTLACSITYPSDPKILSYLHAHLRRCCLDQLTDEGKYAQFTLKSLQGTLDTKGRKYAPSEMEILNTINCRRVYSKVYFLDGQFQAVEFDPCATISEVVEQIKKKIGLKPDCIGYALFQPLDDDCEQVLQKEEKVGDAIAQWESWHKQRQAKIDQQAALAAQYGVNQANIPAKASLASLTNSHKTKVHKFIFKKYLFTDTPFDLDDVVERELQYYQIINCIKQDKFPMNEQEATILCALKAQISIGDYTKLVNLPREHIRMIYKEIVMSLMPPHAFNNLPIPAVAQQHQTFRELNSVDAKKYFFNLVQSFGRANLANGPSYILLHKSHIYEAAQTFSNAWPTDIWIVINQNGLHLSMVKSRNILTSCNYRQIIDYNANQNYLVLIVLANGQNRIKYTFYTKYAQQIAQQMRDYVVIASAAGTKQRKSVGFNIKEAPVTSNIQNNVSKPEDSQTWHHGIESQS